MVLKGLVPRAEMTAGTGPTNGLVGITEKSHSSRSATEAAATPEAVTGCEHPRLAPMDEADTDHTHTDEARPSLRGAARRAGSCSSC